MKAVLLLVLACLAVSCYATLSDSELSKLFVHWSQKHGKTYSNADFQARFEIFKANAHFVHKHNSGNHTFTVALNKFADLTAKEFASIYNGLKVKSVPAPAPLLDFVVPQLPASVDWRTKGAVTPIKNQGQCGSCWSFSTTGSTEGAHHLQARKTLVGLSEQNLVDCSQSYGNQGCNGGLMDDAFKYIIANHGIDTEASYPYTAETGTSCHFNPAHVGATLVSYKDVASESEPALQEAIATRGPISVAIDAGLQSFQLYSGGVYYDAQCSPTSLDHGVLAVGYGVSGSKDYYIVKNSWGSDWGLNGYIWMSRNRNNNCGIATMASFPCATTQCLPQ